MSVITPKEPSQTLLEFSPARREGRGERPGAIKGRVGTPRRQLARESLSLVSLASWRRRWRRRWSRELSWELVESSRVRAETSRVAQRVTKRVAGSLLGLSEPLRSSRLRAIIKAYEPGAFLLSFRGVFAWKSVAPCPLSSELTKCMCMVK